MKWTMQQLQNARVQPLSFEGTEDIATQLCQHKEIRAATPVAFAVTFHARRHVYTCSFTVKGTLTLVCARTLADVSFPFSIDGTAHFVPEGEQPPPTLDEADVYTYTNEDIHLLPAICERIFLEIPIQVYADHPSEVLAPSEGQGWALITEASKQATVDPRLAQLATLFEEKD
ncbi:YceD family protein [Shouchella lonarensis]|uniref:DUF177 domain-containing protein n=1 Tax=Shouchella lonarensis TaxID=1464122 RepID=A0A1G6KUK8_9BACI|nr:YceD family protein [Shouchella lonarensis]SDC34617.1 uncharacterized protein SAMN05421737_107158 [Shouchella lonarensis]